MMPNSFILSYLVTSKLPRLSNCAAEAKAWMPSVASLAGEEHCSDEGESIREGCVRYSMILELPFCGQP